MTVRTQDIRFACSHCGQRIVVDASAAGVETACPGCKRPMVIPDEAMLVDRASVAAVAGRGKGLGRVGFPDGATGVEPLERELATSRRENAGLQEQLRALGEEHAQLRASFAEAATKRQQLAEDHEVARERIKALESEASAMQSRRAAAEQELKEARAEIIRLQDESSLHRRNFDEARTKLVLAETESHRASALEAEMHQLEEKLTTALADGQLLTRRCEELQAEAESARRDLVQTESGRELAALRQRFTTSEEERKRLALQFSDAQSEVRRLTDGERERREQFETMRKERDAALSRAEANSQSALQHGNEVLRGILDRQKSELDERYTELRRLRAAQLSLRILYVLAGLLLFVAIVLGLQTLHQAWR